MSRIQVEALKVTGSVARVIGGTALQTGEDDPGAALKEISLESDAELAAGLPPLLSRIGFSVQREMIPALYGPDHYALTAGIQDRDVCFYLMLVPSWVLGNGARRNLDAFSLLGYILPNNSAVFIVSRGLSSPDDSYKTIFEVWRTKQNISSLFRAWESVQSMLAEKNGDVQITLCRKLFSLASVDKAPQPYTPITLAEKALINPILANYARDVFTSPKDMMQKLVLTAPLPNAGSFGGLWTGDPDLDASKLIEWASTHTHYPPGQGFDGETTLGRLLKKLSESGISPQDEQTLLKIILEHGLIQKKEDVRALQTRLQASTRGGNIGTA